MQVLTLALFLTSKFPDDPPWTFKTPTVRFDLSCFQKDSTSSLVYKSLFAELCHSFPNFHKIFTDGSKSAEGVASAAFSSTLGNSFLSKHIPDDSSAYTAKLTALVLALN